MAGAVVAGARTRAARNSYADLLRTVAIIAVVFGHWLATAVLSRGGRYVGIDALGVISWGSWVTLGLQVVPLFFLVGGYANGASWVRHAAAGELWPEWVRDRVLRLLVPTCAYAAIMAVAVCFAERAHLDSRAVAQAGWAVALHLWFLAAYVVVLLGTPVLYAAHQRWGLGVPVVMALVAVTVDAGVVGWHWPLIGWVNYLLVWGSFHQLGFAWQDGSLTARVNPLLLAGGATLVLIGLIWWGPYPVSMVGVPGARIQNASPPSSALLVFGIAQAGLALAAEPGAMRWLSRHPRSQSRIATAGAMTMPVYLWHMVPVVIVVEAGYPHLVGLPPVGSGRWWQQRPEWIIALSLTLAVLLVVLAGLAALVGATRHRRPSADSRAGSAIGPPALAGERGSVRGSLVVLGVVLTAAAIGQLAVSGFAPGGQLAVGPLVELAGALLLLRGSGRHPTVA